MSSDHSVFDAAAFLSGRGALEVLPGGVLAVGDATASYDPDDITSLLSAHLVLVRTLRRQQREASIVLRRDDVTALAELIGESTAEVIEKLGSLMGATRAQRSAMATLFAAGALVIGLASSGAVIAEGGTAGRIGALSRQSTPTEMVAVDLTEVDLTTEPVLFVDHGATATERTHAGSSRAAERPDASAFQVFADPATGQPEAIGPADDVTPVTGSAVTAVITVTSADLQAGERLPALPRTVIPDTDPALVDIGSAPVPLPYPVETTTAGTGEAGTGDEIIEEPRSEIEPTMVVGHPGEIIEQPWLVIDPPAPGFG